MKKILITGEKSYVGNSFEKWLVKAPGQYSVEKISMRGEEWKTIDYSIYDVIVHVAGIAHQKETKENESLYYEVNRDLSYELAQKAKKDGVKQFIFLSSMSVYGLDSGVISEDTVLNPTSHYGKSKLQAEELIQALADKNFKLAILRPPMIYGKDCPGNYQRLSKLALKTPIFPNVKNKRSMIYVDNLSEFIKVLIDNCRDGLFFPQNSEYINTSEMVRLIAEVHGRQLKLTRVFNPILIPMNNKVNVLRKVFGDLFYDESLNAKHKNYQVSNLSESIMRTEKGYVNNEKY